MALPNPACMMDSEADHIIAYSFCSFVATETQQVVLATPSKDVCIQYCRGSSQSNPFAHLSVVVSTLNNHDEQSVCVL